MEHLIDPQEYVGETVNVTPLADDEWGADFTGTVIGVRHGLLQVRDQGDYVFEVEVGQVTKVTEAPKVPERSVPPSEQELMERQTTMLRQDGKSWEEIARLYGEMLIREREERSRSINQKNRAEELLRANQAKGYPMKPVCPHCGAVGSMSEIDRVAVLQKVQSVTAEGKIELVTGAGDVDWECQYPRDNPSEFQCRECGSECSREALIAATRKAQPS